MNHHMLPAITAQGIRRGQAGMTLLELLVAMFLGLLVVGMGLGTLLISQQLSAITTDAAALQQQASYALRVIGQQIRQAGSVELDLVDENNPRQDVAFRVGYQNMPQIISGNQDSGGKSILFVGYQNYLEPIVDQLAPDPSNEDHRSLFRNCLGEGGKGGDAFIQNTFKFKPPDGDQSTGALVCDGGSGSGAQQLIRNVADFQVRYLEQENTDTNPTLTWKTTGSVNRWSNVVAVSICLDLVGDERVPGTSNETYIDCSNDETGVAMNDRMHSVFRNTFQIRSHGVIRAN